VVIAAAGSIFVAEYVNDPGILVATMTNDPSYKQSGDRTSDQAKSLWRLCCQDGLLKANLERRAETEFVILTYHRILERKGP
jgi:hypothetical protein